MSAFRYEAIDNEGRTARGVIEADGLRQARARMRELGLTVIKVDAVTQDTLHSGSGQRWRLRRGISSSQLSMLTRQLATLLRLSHKEAMGCKVKVLDEKRQSAMSNEF